MTQEIAWVELTHAPSRGRREPLPLWQRAFGVTPDDTMFAPVAAAGVRSEGETLEAARAEGLRVFWFEGHAFAPIDWVEARSPAAKMVCDVLRRAAARLRDEHS